ncbi:sugar nucleotide-binding protein [Candidatus Pelagibacter sp.]|nr:sugar nucleotide-binding protein [Candidatus Pelagibacter sp.]
MNIVFTGGKGRFGKIFQKKTKLKNIFFPSREELNILNLNSIKKYLIKKKIKIVIHAAALSRPMDIHDKKISLSIDKNIIGTCNLVKVCETLNLKIIYLSTNYVYPGKKGDYKETDPLLPYNNYAWSKLGGECAVQMYKNSLILRICMTEKPFIHNFAFKDLITNFIFHEDVVKMFPKLIKQKGIINIGGKKSSVHKFAKQYNKKILGVFASQKLKRKIPLNHSMSLLRLKKILK